MFQGALHIWSIHGIPIRIHFTWLFIFGLLRTLVKSSVATLPIPSPGGSKTDIRDRRSSAQQMTSLLPR